MNRALAAGLTLAAVVWSVLIVAAPFVVQTPAAAGPASILYTASSRICHQRPERSFAVGGFQMPVCARCSGLYVSGALGALFGWTRRRTASRGRRRSRPFDSAQGRHEPVEWLSAATALMVAAIPTAITLGLELMGVTRFSNLARATAALPLGAVTGWLFVRMLRYDSRLDAHKNAYS